MAIEVLALGASARGLNALETLLSHARPDGQVAYLVQSRLAENRTFELQTRLRRASRLDVEILTRSGQMLAADTIYIVPPGRRMHMQRGHIYTSARSSDEAKVAQTVPNVTASETERLLRAELHMRAAQTEQLTVLGKLAGGVAHEFNNLNAIVLANLGIIESSQPLTAESQKYFAQVKEAILRSKEITYELLSLSRAESADLEVFNIVASVNTAISLEKDQLVSAGICCALQAPDQSIYIRGSAGSITRALINMLVNSTHALAEAEDPKIDISIARAAGDQVEITIADNGIGIAPADLDRVFDPFFTTKGDQAAANSPMLAFQGTGLGLSLVKATVERHGGSIAVESTPSAGTRVVVHLPMAQRQTAIAQSQPSASVVDALPNSALQGQRVLIVDNDEGIRVALTTILQTAGMRTRDVPTVHDAKQALGDQQYDLLLLDWSMPEGGGAEVLRSLEVNAPGLVVVLSGARVPLPLPVPDRYQDRCFLIRKPFEVAELLGFLSARLAGDELVA